MPKHSAKSVFVFAVTSLLVAAFVVLGKCAYDRRLRRLDAEVMRLGAEDVSRRLTESRISLAAVQEFCGKHGLDSKALESEISAADYKQIAATTRIGRGGRVNVSELRGEADRIGSARSRTTIEERDGDRWISLHTDCGDYRIVVSLPYRGWRLADDRPYQLIIVFVVMLLVVILLSGVNMFGRSGFAKLASELKMLFRRPEDDGRRVSSVVIVLSVIFILATAVAWFYTTSAYREVARELLAHSMDDFTEDFNTAPDCCLYYVGKAITSHYRTPEKATELDVHELMNRYGIDELNVVDRNGIVLRGDLANVGFDFHSNSNTVKFLRLLTNDWVYAQDFRAAIEDPSIVRKYAGVAFPDHNGFVQIGFAEKRIREDFDYRFRPMAQDWAIGTAGFYVLARDDGTIVSSGHPDFKRVSARGDISTLDGIGFCTSLIPRADADDQYFEANLYGKPCLCISKKLGSYHRLIAAIPIERLDSNRNYAVGFVALLLLVLLGAGTILGTRLSNLVSQLRKFIAEDTRRRAEELKNAKAIQIESLPTVFPDFDDYKIFARMDTAKEVGGDFYDFYTLPSGRQLFLIADTSGKGIPAAMFMMKAKAVIRAGLFETSDFAAAVIDANSRLAENNDASMFVTAWIGLFDRKTGEVQFVNCGHNPPLIKHADGSVSWVRSSPGLALAAMGGAKYRVESLTLARGESLFLYTDGVTEAMNGAGEQYGEKRLEADLAAAPNFQFVNLLRDKVAEFVAGAEQSDDITMLALDRK